MTARSVAALIALATVLVSPAAHAQSASDPTASSTSDASPVDATPRLLETHRTRPDYDGLPEPGPDAGEVLIWIPRILFAPVTLVLDYGLRRPLGELATVAEREGWPALVLNTFTWNERRSGIIPTFFLAYGLQPSVGLQIFSNDEIAPGHSVRGSFAYGGSDFLSAGAAYAIRMSSDRVRLELRGTAAKRPDRVFSDIGWNTVEAQYRFREEWYETSLRLDVDFWRESRLSLRVGVDGHQFDPNGYAAFSTSPSLEEAIQTGRVLTPPGLESGYAAYRQGAEIAIDTRELEPAPGHGLRIEAQGELAFDPGDPQARRWVRWGGAMGAFVDLGDRRVLGLWGLARFSDPLGPAPVVFTELIALGQEALLMQGFLQGQLRGRSAVAATLEYIYPVWTQLDGRLHLSVGNVFGEHLVDFRAERLRASFGLGVSTAGEPDEALHFAIAAGTAPLIQGAAIESVQLVVGSRQGL